MKQAIYVGISLAALNADRRADLAGRMKAYARMVGLRPRPRG